MTLSLGTVQLGVSYGVNNPHEAPSESAAMDLLEAAWQAGFRMVDTSPEYGRSIEFIGKYLKIRPDAFEVVVKLNAQNPADRRLERQGCLDGLTT
jgi:aryl-alcohol dehydrogenase-like predicted oxidoreductase